MDLPFILILSAVGISIPLMFFFAIRTNAQFKPDRMIEGTKTGVILWDDDGKRATDLLAPGLQIDGIDEFLRISLAFLAERYGKKMADKIMNFDLWVFPLEAKALGVQTPNLYNPDGSYRWRASGSIEPFYTWFGLRRRVAVRIRKISEGDVTYTALAHEIAWHLVPKHTRGNPNIKHELFMNELEQELTSAYLLRSI